MLSVFTSVLVELNISLCLRYFIIDFIIIVVSLIVLMSVTGVLNEMIR